MEDLIKAGGKADAFWFRRKVSLNASNVLRWRMQNLLTNNQVNKTSDKEKVMPIHNKYQFKVAV